MVTRFEARFSKVPKSFHTRKATANVCSFTWNTTVSGILNWIIDRVRVYFQTSDVFEALARHVVFRYRESNSLVEIGMCRDVMSVYLEFKSLSWRTPRSYSNSNLNSLSWQSYHEILISLVYVFDIPSSFLIPRIHEIVQKHFESSVLITKYDHSEQDNRSTFWNEPSFFVQVSELGVKYFHEFLTDPCGNFQIY